MTMLLGVIYLYKTFYVDNREIIHREHRLVLRWQDCVAISVWGEDDIGYNLDTAYKRYKHAQHDTSPYLSIETFVTE